MGVEPQIIAAWLRRLLMLDARVFEEVRGNPTATVPAVIVVILSMLLSGLGGWLWWVVQDYPSRSTVLVDSAILGSLIAVALWAVVWVVIVYLFLTRVFGERVFLEQLLRVMGLATAPLALTALMAIPVVSFGMGVAPLVLTFGLTSIAIQSVTNANPLRVLAANVAGFAAWAAVLSLLVSASHVYAPGIFVFLWPSELSASLFELTEQFDLLP